MILKDSKTGSLREKSRTDSSTSENSSSSDFGSIGKYKKDKRKTGTSVDIRSKSLKKEKKEKKEKRLSDTDPPKRHSSETGHVPKTELNVTITTIVEQPTKLETTKLDSRYYRKSTDVECQIIFYDDNFNTVLKLVDSEEDNSHWEFMLQKGGGSVNRLDTMRKQKKYLSSIASVYEREVSESKYGLLRFISENILKGTKRTYLNYLIDHHTISVTYSQVVDSTNTSSTSSSTPTITKPRHSVSDSLGIESLKIVGHRRSQSVANRNPARRTSVSRASFASNDSNYSSMPQSGIRSPLIQVNGVPDESSSGNSSKGGTGVSQHSLENSSSSKYNTMKEDDDQLQYTLENLLKEERFLEAKECITFMKSHETLQKLNSEYEKAKSEDLLHEAIVIRDKIKAIKDTISAVVNDPLIMDSWNGKPPSSHKTLQQIHEYIIDRVGTKLALPFIEEFADINLTIIAKDDLEKAISLQQKAIERLLVLAPPLSDEEEREKRKKEEEERWRKEAEEKKKKKKKDRESTLRQLSESTADFLSNPSSDPVLVPIVDNHK